MADPRSQATSAQSKIGWVEKISGQVTVVHADGRSETLRQGAPVLQGDVIKTAAGANVGLVFTDRSTFHLAGNGEMVLDEFVFDPAAPGDGSSSISLLKGTFSLASGQIAHAHPGAQSIRTPTMSVGIRGTTIAGEVAADGSVSLALLPDRSGQVGEIALTSSSGESTVINTAGVGVSGFSGGSIRVGAVDTGRYGSVAASLPSHDASPPPSMQSVPMAPPADAGTGTGKSGDAGTGAQGGNGGEGKAGGETKAGEAGTGAPGGEAAVPPPPPPSAESATLPTTATVAAAEPPPPGGGTGGTTPPPPSAPPPPAPPPATTPVPPAINTAPVGGSVVLAGGTEDTPVVIAKTALLLNAFDADGDTLSVSNVTADHGVVTDNNDGTVTLSPAADYSGPVTLSYTVADGRGGTDLGTAAMHLNAVADAPVVSASTVSGAQASSIALSLTAALADADGSETLSLTLSGVPAGSALVDGLGNPVGTETVSGTWAVTAGDLATLHLVPPGGYTGAATLTLTATATETVSGLTASSSVNETVTVTAVASAAPVLAGGDSLVGGAVFAGSGTPGQLVSTGTVTLGSNFTYEAWIKDAGSPNFGGIVTTTGGAGQWAQMAVLGGCLGVETYNGGVGMAIGTIPITDGQWHHVAAVFDGTTVSLYVDGVLDASGGANLFSTPLAIGIGRDQAGTVFFKGEIADVKVWTESRTAVQVAADSHTNPAGNETALAAWYLHDEAAVTTNSATSGGFGAAAVVGTVTAASAPSYTESGSAAAVFTNLHLSDADSANLASATVTIANHGSGDQLNFVDQNGITGSYNPATGVLTLTGSDTLANYRTALGSITFSNTDATMPGADRVVTLVVNDGTADSGLFSQTLRITGIGNTLTATGSVDALDGGAGNDTYTVGGADFAAGDAITDSGRTADTDIITLTSGGTTDLSVGTVTGIETIQFHTGGGTLVLGGGADPQQLNSIAGSGGMDVVKLADSASVLDLTGVTLTGIDTISSGAGNDTVAFDDVSANTLGIVVDGDASPADNDVVRFSMTQGGSMDISGIVTANMESVVLQVSGTSANVTLIGNNQGNTLIGGAGNDYLIGGNGNDTFVASAGLDVIDGGAGSDTVSYAAATSGVTVDLASGSAIHGGSTNVLTGIESAVGSAYADTLVTAATTLGTLTGGAGNDTYVLTAIPAANQSFTDSSGTGDILTLAINGHGIDYAFRDIRWNGSALEFVTLGGSTLSLSGIDFLNAVGWSSPDALVGAGGQTSGDDTVVGRGGDTALAGGGGSDTLVWVSGVTAVDGGSGNDDTADFRHSTVGVVADLSTAAATVDGASVSMTGIEGVVGGSGDDTLTGNAGTANVFMGGAGSNIITGNAGDNDMVSYGDALSGVTANLTTGTATHDGGTDTLTGIAGIAGSDFNDTITGGAAGGWVSGGAGNDSLTNGGSNTLSYTDSPAGVTVNLQTGTATDGWGGTDTLSGFTSVTGSGFNDTLTGAATNDWLDGRQGTNVLTGNAGSDSFVASSGGMATITDFTAGQDNVTLRNSDFGLGSTGTLAAANYAEDPNSAHTITGTTQNFSGGVHNAGIVAIDDGSGGTNIWYTADMANATMANSQQIAHTTVDTSAIDNTSFHLAI